MLDPNPRRIIFPIVLVILITNFCQWTRIMIVSRHLTIGPLFNGIWNRIAFNRIVFRV